MKKPAHYQTLEFDRVERIFYKFGCDRTITKRVLDYGCGRGKYLNLFHKLGFEVVGVDMNPIYVKEGRSAGFAMFSIEELSLTQMFDIIFVSHVVEHMQPDGLAGLIPSLCKHLVPGGRLVIIAPLLGERFYYDASHIRPYYTQSIRNAFGQEDAPLSFGGRNLIKLTDIYFFRDPFRIRQWRSFYFGNILLKTWTRLLNLFFETAWRASGGRIGIASSWLGVYEKVSQSAVVIDR